MANDPTVPIPQNATVGASVAPSAAPRNNLDKVAVTAGRSYGVRIPEDASVGNAQTSSSLWDRISSPLISGSTIRKGIDYATGISPGAEDKATERAIAHGKPTEAAISAFGSGVEKSTADLLSSFTSPASLGLMAASGSESAVGKSVPAIAKLLKISQVAAALGYGAQGAKQAATARQPGESLPDEMERRLFGAATALGGAAGAGAITKDAVRNALRKKLGLNDDLASRVSAKIAQKNQIERQSQADLAKVRDEGATAQREAQSRTAQTVTAVEQHLDQQLQAMQGQTSARITDLTQQAGRTVQEAQSKLPGLEQRKLQTAGRILGDAAQYLHQEKTNFHLRFDSIGDKVEGPVAVPGDITEVVKQAFSGKGISEAEIPTSAVRALNGGDGGARTSGRLTQSELNAAGAANKMLQSGMKEPDVKDAMVNLGYAPRQVEAIMATVRGVSEKPAGLSFNQLTRVKNDLYDAAVSAKDGGVKAALFDASDKVSDLQEEAAEKAGLGPKYKALKSEYSNFMRGIGSEMVHKLLASYDAEDQDMAGKISKLTDSRSSGALKTVLNAAGIDTSDLDEVMEQIESTEKTVKTAPAEARAGISKAERQGATQTAALKSEAGRQITEAKRTGAREATAARAEAAAKQQVVESEAQKGVKEAEAEGEIIPGKKSSELAGMSNDRLLRERLQTQAAKMRSAGIHSPYALFNIVYGLSQLVAGSAWGAMHIGRGVGMSELPEMVKSKSFQDWVLRKSGVEPTDKLLTAKIRKGIAGLYPLLRRAVASGVQEQATANAPRAAQVDTPARQNLIPAVPSGQSVWSNPIQ